MDYSGAIVFLISASIVIGVIGGVAAVIFNMLRKKARESKDYERSLKMVQLRIQLPPGSDDKDLGSRDLRDVTDETVSRAQNMYNVVASTATKGFYSRIFGQRHISFEIVASGGLVHYYVAVPLVLVDNIKQAIMASYPNARLEEVEEINLFSKAGRISGTMGGELTLSKSYIYPIETFKDSKQDAMGAILNAMTSAARGEGLGVQILLRPARDDWTKRIEKGVGNIRDGKKASMGGGIDMAYFAQMLEVLWRPPTSSGDKDNAPKPLSGNDQTKIEAMEEKARHAGYEVMIRLVVSTPSLARSQTLLTSLQSAFSLFNSPTGNSLQFKPASNIEDFVTAYIMRFFPAHRTSDILNTVELASIFHLPDQTNIPSTQVERQLTREVDGPHQPMDPNGLLIGYNYFRGVKKEIRLGVDDRRRHTYIMGSTGMGKSVFLKNLALQDMRAGRGFAFVDPHGDAAQDLLCMVPENRVNDVIYFNPSDMENPIGMNLFEISPDDPDPERTRDYIIAEISNMLTSLYDPNNQGFVGPRMLNIVRYASILLMSDPEGGTFMDIPKVLVDPEFAKSKIKYLKNQRAIDFWTKEWPNAQRSNDAGEVTSWVVSKWSDFESSMMTNILGQLKSRIDFRKVMDEGKILLVDLSKGRMGELPAKLMGMIFVMKFQAAAMSRASLPEEERRDFCLYVDEFQNFATDSFESILSEARKYRLNLIVANQFMSQLVDKIKGAITGNAGTFIIGRCGTDDVDEIVKLFQPIYQPEDLLFMPNYMAATKLLINGYPTQPFTMKLPPPMSQPNKQLGQSLAAISAQKYGRPRAEVEAEIRERLSVISASHQSQASASSIGNQPSKPSSTGSAFLDNWLAKRQTSTDKNKINTAPSTPTASPDPLANLSTPAASPNPSALVAPPNPADNRVIDKPISPSQDDGQYYSVPH